MPENNINLVITNFKGLRNDLGEKFVTPEYFFRIENFNYDNIIGANKILFPTVVLNETTTFSGSKTPVSDVDGIFEFNFRDPTDVIRQEEITIIDGKIFRNFLTIPEKIYSGLTSGNKIDFSILSDRLFMTNGVDFPLVYDGEAVWEMGSPKASETTSIGLPTGTYFYSMTYTINGVETNLGTVSNTLTVSTKRIELSIPIGPFGTTERKIFRTENGGTVLKLVTTIADNLTITFTDNIADASLGAVIIAVNFELPKPRFIESIKDRLAGSVVANRPTELFIGDTFQQFFTLLQASNISGRGNDNTAITGLSQDYDQLIIASRKHFYITDASVSPVTTKQTQTNIGVKDGYTMVRIPDNEDFSGGIMFVSTLNDVRVFNGNIAVSLSTSLDNLKTDNWAQVIRGTLSFDLEISTNLYAEFFDYKYHLIVGDIFYVFDIRGNKWSNHKIMTDNFESLPNVLGLIQENLYTGQSETGIIERNYGDTKYRGDDIPAFFESPQLIADEKMKYFKELRIYYDNASLNSLDVRITIESQIGLQIKETVNINGGSFDPKFYDNDFFLLSEDQEDYKTIYINRYGRWIEFRVDSTKDIVGFRGFRIMGTTVTDKEVA